MTNQTEVRRQRPLGRIKQVHMVGIGGIGMSSIAEVLLARGYRVTGSDLTKSEVTDRLESLGAHLYERHSAHQIDGADVVVYSSAVQPKENPETLEAIHRRIPLIPRSEMLGELMRMKYGIGIAGTHGKTTTTSMVGLVVTEGGYDPTIIVGGKVTYFGAGSVTGQGDIIVIEADEYDRTFLRLTPSIAVVTSIEEEHLDTYRDLEDIKDAFVHYASSVPFFGAAILCLDDPVVQQIISRLDRRVVTYGLSRQAEIRAENVTRDGLSMTFDVYHGADHLFTCTTHAPGIHNVLNALAAVAVGLELDIQSENIVQALGKFSGVQRRFQVRGEVNGIMVVDDYAHHPTEIRVTLEAASSGWPERRIIAVFQPHLYSRTRDFMEGFAHSFFDADTLIVTEIYGSREEPIPDVSGRAVAELAKRYGHRNAHFAADKKTLNATLSSLAQPGDMVILMGAGDIWRASEMFLNKLKMEQATHNG